MTQGLLTWTSDHGLQNSNINLVQKNEVYKIKLLKTIETAN